MNEETLEQLQTKIAFLERATADLGDMVFRQQVEIRALSSRLQEVLERLAAAQDDDRRRPVDDERPPHY